MRDTTFTTMLALLTTKLVDAETHISDQETHIRADHEEMDRMQRTITDLRTRNEEMYDEKRRLEDRVWELESKERIEDDLRTQVERLKEEVRTLKYGEGPVGTRLHTYMAREGGKLWNEGNKILCIKGVRECSGWGLKESKDWAEANGPTYAPKVASAPSLDLKEESSPHTKPSEDLVRKSA